MAHRSLVLWATARQRILDQALTVEEKRERFASNKYSFPVPTGPTGFWTEVDWFNYIDMSGVWCDIHDKVRHLTDQEIKDFFDGKE